MTEDCREITACRLCGKFDYLREILDFGTQALGGQFPKIGEEDPPSFPLVLLRCAAETGGCGLVQLAHTVNPELMFKSYGYRSGVSQTMRRHLKAIAHEAQWVLEATRTGRAERLNILDIGGNDGTLLDYFHPTNVRVVVDPSNVHLADSAGNIVRFLFYWPPKGKSGMGPFDLIFSIACFYDADDPVAWAKGVRDHLEYDGLWCVEVADLRALHGGGWDSVCHEHLCYYDGLSMSRVSAMSGLDIIKSVTSDCNGGSIRFYLKKIPDGVPTAIPPSHDQSHWQDWAGDVAMSKRQIVDFLDAAKDDGLKIHLLGASTKANTWLQYCGITPQMISAASDRDPRKKGRRTPGTGIPIISEEESRAEKPDVYLCPLYGFRDEIIEREHKYLSSGGRIIFPLPSWSEVTAESS